MNEISTISTAQMIEVDRAMIEDYHIELIQMMENAGRNLADLARRRFLDSDLRDAAAQLIQAVNAHAAPRLETAVTHIIAQEEIIRIG